MFKSNSQNKYIGDQKRGRPTDTKLPTVIKPERTPRFFNLKRKLQYKSYKF